MSFGQILHADINLSAQLKDTVYNSNKHCEVTFVYQLSQIKRTYILRMNDLSL